MTYSIVARDARTGELGIAVASRFFAVGARVPFVRTCVGAIASQAYLNPTYGKAALDMLESGLAPAEIAARLIASDDGSRQRQFHLIGADGRNTAYTGEDCIDWAGHLVDDNVSVAGNTLTGPDVVGDTMEAYKAAMDLPLIERLLAAMQAGEDAGGDKRGRQSAGIIIYGDQDTPWLDIRTDDHGDPLEELRRLYDVAKEKYLIFAETLATRENPHGCLDRADIDRQMATIDAEVRAGTRRSRSHATLTDIS